MGRKGSPWVSFLGWRCLRASVAPGSVAPGSPRRPSPAPRTDPELWLARPKPAARLWRRRGLGPPGLPAPGSCRRPRSGAPSPGGRPGPGGPLGSLSSSPPPPPAPRIPPPPGGSPRCHGAVAMAPLPANRLPARRSRRSPGPEAAGPHRYRPGPARGCRHRPRGERRRKRRTAAGSGCSGLRRGVGRGWVCVRPPRIRIGPRGADSLPPAAGVPVEPADPQGQGTAGAGRGWLGGWDPSAGLPSPRPVPAGRERGGPGRSPLCPPRLSPGSGGRGCACPPPGL